MDFGSSELEGMLIESATTFAERCLKPRERSHEKEGEPDAETRRAWAECGLDMLADSSGDLEVSGPGRVQVLRALASVDGAATLALWFHIGRASGARRPVPSAPPRRVQGSRWARGC